MSYDKDEDTQGVRLQRVLAAAGLGSRRACEQLIEEGRVEVDGKKVVVQGMRVDPKKAVIKVDGLRIASAPDHVYLVLNKPKGVVSTMSDPRAAVAAGVRRRPGGPAVPRRPAGPGHRGTHPAHQRRRPRAPAVPPVVRVEKTYLAEVTGPVARDVGKRLKQGVELEDGLVQVDSFRWSARSARG